MNVFYTLLSKFTTQPQPVAPSGLQPDCLLKKSGAKTLHHLLSVPQSKERTETLNKAAKVTLELAQDWEDVDWRQFGLMHTSSHMRETALSGGTDNASIDAWLYLFQLLKDRVGYVLSCNVTAVQIDNVIDRLIEYKLFGGLLNLRAGLNKPMDRNLLLETVKNLLIKITVCLGIKAQAGKPVHVSMPLGYRSGVLSVGHTVPCKIELAGDQVRVHLMNRGNGGLSHPILDTSTSQDMVSFSYFPVKFIKEKFFGFEGYLIFSHLIRYINDPPDTKCQPYSGEDIYDVFLTMGELDPNLGPNPEKLKALFQNGGDCPELGAQMIVSDQLIEDGLSALANNQIILNLFLVSLMQGYHSHLRNPTPQSTELLRNAAEQFGIKFKGMERHYSFEEKTLVSGIIRLIMQETKSAKPSLKHFRRTVTSPPLMTSLFPPSNPYVGTFPDAFPTIDTTRVVDPMYALDIPKTESSRAVIHPVFNPKTFLDEVQSWVAKLDAVKGYEVFEMLYTCIRVLPIPQWEGVGPWDEVPELHIKGILLTFETLLQKGLKNALNPREIKFFEYFLTIYTLFAIADKLARRNCNNKLEGFASPFLLHIVPFEPKEFISIPIGEENRRFTQIERYFSNSFETCKRFIFPVKRCLSVERAVNDCKNGSAISQEIFHLKFLEQFFDGKSGLNNGDLTASFLTLWHDKNKNLLPREIHSLYYFALLSYVLFDGVEFPQSLSFTEDLDKGFRKGLKITLSGDRNQLRSYEEDGGTAGTILEFNFRSMSSNYPYHGNFVPLFERRIEGITTNDAICAHLDEIYKQNYKISEAVYRDLLRISRKKDLRVGLALQWLSSNINLLSHLGIQWAIDCFFFGSYGVQDRLEQEPVLLEEFRACIQKGLDYFHNNPFHITAILFLIRTGILFETHAMAALGKSDNEKILKYYEKILDELLEQKVKEDELTEINMHRIFVAMIKRPSSQEDIRDAFIWAFKYINLHPKESPSPWLQQKMPFFIRNFSSDYQKELAHKPTRDLICNALFIQAGFKDQSTQSSWEGAFPCYTCGEYEINFLDATILKKGHGALISASKNFADSMLWGKGISKAHGNQFWYDEANNRHTSIDGKLRICYIDGKRIAEREIEIKGRKKWYYLAHFSDSETDPKKMHFLSYPDYLPFLHYLPVIKEADDPEFIIFDKDQDIPLIRVDYVNGQAHFTRLDEKGNVLPYKLVNLVSVTQHTHPLYQMVVRFAQVEYVLCFCSIDTQEVRELHFYKLKLKFLYNDTNKRLELQSKDSNLENFYLSSETLPALNHFDGAYVLAKEEGADKMIKVIIPPRFLATAGNDFEKKVVITEDSFVMDEKYYIFDYDPHQQILVSNSVAGNLYLAYLFQKGRDYIKANLYLDRAHTSQSLKYDEERLITELKDFKDFAPEALAFKMKVHFYLIHNRNQMIESCFHKKEHNRLNTDFYNCITEDYTDYLRAFYCENDDEQGGQQHVDQKEDVMTIPKELRLTRDQEKDILFFLKEFYDAIEKKQKNTVKKKSDKITMPKLLLMRYHLFCSPKQSITSKISDKQISLRPFAYTQLRKPKDLWLLRIDSHEFPYGATRRDKAAKKNEDVTMLDFPNRVSSAVIESYFPILFREALTCSAAPCEFDLILLACLKSARQKTQMFDLGPSLASLLFYVRHSSALRDSFKSLKNITFDQVPNQLAIAAFNMVISVVTKFHNSPAYKEDLKKLMKAEGVFKYQKERVLSLSKEKELQPLTVNSPSNIEHKDAPFRPFCEKLFQKSEDLHSLPADPPFLVNGAPVEQEGIKGVQLQTYLTGYEELKKVKFPTYQLRPGQLEKVKEEMKNPRDVLRTSLESKRKNIEQLANKPFKVRGGSLSRDQLEAEIDSRFSREIRQTIKVTPELIMSEAVIKNDLRYLQQHCPLLTKEEHFKLIEWTKEFYHTLVLLSMFEEAEKLIGKVQKHPDNPHFATELAELLDYEFQYDPKAYPEIDYFRVMEGKLPRPDQFRIYKWVCEGIDLRENRLFALPSGRGKSSYLMALFYLRLQRVDIGLTPVTVTTQAIYPVEKDNLSTILSKFNIRLSFLEVGMHMKLTAEQVKFIYQQLQFCKKSRGGLLITPQIFSTLKLLRYYAGIKEKDVEKVKWFGYVMNFFKKDCFLLGDEEHRNFDALIRAIFGVGEFFILPPNEGKLFLELLKPLLGVTKVVVEGRELADIARMKTNLQGKPTEEEIKILQNSLARHIVFSTLLNIPKEEHETFIHYWTDKKAQQPTTMKNWGTTDKQRADLASLVGYFILDLLPEIVKLRTNFDHGPSMFPEEKHETPWHDRVPSTAQYKDAYRALALSIKGLFHRGLSKVHLQLLIERLIEEDWRELGNSLSTRETDATIKFKGWVDKPNLTGPHLRDISLSNTEQMDSLMEVLSKHPTTLEYFFTTIVAPQIGPCVEELYSTPSHLLNGFACGILFSATPLIDAANPRGIKKTLLDPCFEAHVAATFCNKANQEKIFPEDTAEFFETLKEGSKTIYKDARVFIDPGGFFCDIANDKVAEECLASTELDGMFYFKEGKTLSVDRDEKICLILRDKRVFEFKGSEIKTALAKAQLDWEKLNLGTYFDSRHIESANVAQKPGTKAFVFGGDLLTVSRLVQAIMRLRGFLDLKLLQTIIWVFQKQLARKISPKQDLKALDGAHTFDWSLNNDSAEMKKRVILNAYQDIAYAIARQAEEEIDKHLDDPAKQIELMLKYAPGLLETYKHDPHGHFGDHEKEEDTDVALERFAKKHYALFAYGVQYDDDKTLNGKISENIKAAKKLVPKISTNFKNTIAEQVEQHFNVNEKKRTEQMEYCPRPFDPLSSEGEYGQMTITDPEYVDKAYKHNVRTTFNTNGLTKDFYLEHNQLLTAKNAGESMKENFLKPVDFFVIVIEKEKNRVTAMAVSNDILSNLLRDMRKCKETHEKILHQAFVVTSDGKSVYQRGKGPLTPADADVKEIMASTWMKDLAIDAALLRGEIVHADRLIQRIKTNWPWHEFEAFWKRTVKCLPNPETANHYAFNQLRKIVSQENK